MENLNHYRYKLEEWFLNFIKKRINVDELVELLQMLETEHRFVNDLPKDDKGLWFKFGKYGTTVNTISDFEQTLKNGTRENKEFLLECMQMACTIDPNSEVQIFYS